MRFNISMMSDIAQRHAQNNQKYIYQGRCLNMDCDCVIKKFVSAIIYSQIPQWDHIDIEQSNAFSLILIFSTNILLYTIQ